MQSGYQLILTSFGVILFRVIRFWCVRARVLCILASNIIDKGLAKSPKWNSNLVSSHTLAHVMELLLSCRDKNWIKSTSAINYFLLTIPKQLLFLCGTDNFKGNCLRLLYFNSIGCKRWCCRSSINDTTRKRAESSFSF